MLKKNVFSVFFTYFLYIFSKTKLFDSSKCITARCLSIITTVIYQKKSGKCWKNKLARSLNLYVPAHHIFICRFCAYFTNTFPSRRSCFLFGCSSRMCYVLDFYQHFQKMKWKNHLLFRSIFVFFLYCRIFSEFFCDSRFCPVFFSARFYCCSVMWYEALEFRLSAPKISRWIVFHHEKKRVKRDLVFHGEAGRLRWNFSRRVYYD